MARAGARYPQVDPGARALISAPLATGSATSSARQALDACRRAGVRALAIGSRRVVRERDLARAVDWGLGDRPARLAAWTGLPVVGIETAEIEVRRHLIAGAPMIVVRDGSRLVGLIDRQSANVQAPMSALPSVLRPASEELEARLAFLRAVGSIAVDMGTRAFAVGGFVRDPLLERPSPDVDLVIEGDGVTVARRLADAVGGTLTAHEAFLTASIKGGRAPGGAPLGRIDVASARRERYERPGALPIVSPADIDTDLARRDFSVNAMAIALSPPAFGALLDPHGGRADLTRRRLRPLHPLSFVEDPTRMFRAARYAARLGLRLETDARTALRLALCVGEYPALSGQRLEAEIQWLAAEATAAIGFELLLRWAVPALWDARYRVSAASVRRVRALARLSSLMRRAAPDAPAADLSLTALLLDQSPAVRIACLDRLAIRGQRRRILESAAAGSLARRLAAPALRSSEVAELLRPVPPIAVAGAWLRGGRRVRRRVEWFLTEGRAVRPLLSGDELMSLGVPRGPAVGECLAGIRRLRADGIVRSMGQERQFVKRWLRGPRPEPTPVPRGGER